MAECRVLTAECLFYPNKMPLVSMSQFKAVFEKGTIFAKIEGKEWLEIRLADRVVQISRSLSTPALLVPLSHPLTPNTFLTARVGRLKG